jgi:hypothetical protein
MQFAYYVSLCCYGSIWFLVHCVDYIYIDALNISMQKMPWILSICGHRWGRINQTWIVLSKGMVGPRLIGETLINQISNDFSNLKKSYIMLLFYLFRPCACICILLHGKSTENISNTSEVTPYIGTVLTTTEILWHVAQTRYPIYGGRVFQRIGNIH